MKSISILSRLRSRRQTPELLDAFESGERLIEYFGDPFWVEVSPTVLRLHWPYSDASYDHELWAALIEAAWELQLGLAMEQQGCDFIVALGPEVVEEFLAFVDGFDSDTYYSDEDE